MKYYINTAIKNDTVELLMSKFGLQPEVAWSLYCTEYRYEYTPDGEQCAIAYICHYDMLGNEILRTDYEDKEKVFFLSYGSR